MKGRNLFFGLVLLLFAFRIILSFGVWHPDLNNHADWGVRFWEYGTKAFYSQNVWNFTWPNQPPGTMYLFALCRKVFEFVFSIFWQINVRVPAFPSGIISFFELNLYPSILKLPAILADFGIAYLIYRFVLSINPKLTREAHLGAIIWLINPVVWYNSSVWGQYDSVINFLVLLSFYLLTQRKLSLATLAFALSIYTKASLLIFAPLWLIYVFKLRFKVSTIAISATLALLMLFFLTLPFSKGNAVIWLYELYKDKIFGQQLHVINANAFNLWAGLTSIYERPETLPFLGANYRVWSGILFALAYIPLLYSLFKKWTVENLIWVLALAAFVSFTLLTNMHERYLFPLFPYLTILLSIGVLDKIKYWAISVINLANLYNFWFTPKVVPIVFLLSVGDRVVPRILGFILFGLFVSTYASYLRQAKLQRL